MGSSKGLYIGRSYKMKNVTHKFIISDLIGYYI